MVLFQSFKLSQLNTNLTFCCFKINPQHLENQSGITHLNCKEEIYSRVHLLNIYKISVRKSGGLLLFIRSRYLGQILLNKLICVYETYPRCRYLTWRPVAFFIRVYISILLHAVKN